MHTHPRTPVLTSIGRHVRRNAVAWIALMIAVSGTAYAAKINSSMIAKNAVRSSHVKNQTLTGSDIAPGTRNTFTDTPAEIVARLLTVDGPGSGVDADTIDGVTRTVLDQAPAARGVQSGGASTTTGVDSVLTYGSASYDSGDILNISTGEFTIPKAGLYHLAANAEMDNNGAGIRRMEALVNGTPLLRDEEVVSGGADTYFHVDGVLDLDAGDVVTFRTHQNSGVTLNREDGGTWGQVTWMGTVS